MELSTQFWSRYQAERMISSGLNRKGNGVEPRYLERIFGMFQRLHKQEVFAGSGVGLAIWKKVLERHGSNISVESQLGEGSSFHFSLTDTETKLRT
jgi:light-regulated signal transduction histidine kinase (bacteriophytochrome)